VSQLRGYVRATFLHWGESTALLVFGEAIVQIFMRKAARYNLDFAGIVGRPLYVCGALKPAQAPERESLFSSVPVSDSTIAHCLNIASMSPLLKFKGEQYSWRCTQCAKAGLPADSSHRMLRLYPLVRVPKAGLPGCTPLRSKPITVAVAPPPAEFDWKQHAGTSTSTRTAEPKLIDGSVYATFGSDESRSIWLMSARYGARQEDRCLVGASR
jgi:hypothetical protein